MKAKQKPARRGAQSRPAWAQKRMPSILGLLLLGNENMRLALRGPARGSKSAEREGACSGAASGPVWHQERMPAILGLLLLRNENMRKALSGFKWSRQKGKGKAGDRSAR